MDPLGKVDIIRRDYVKVHLLPRLHALCFNLGYGRQAFEYRWRLSPLLWNPFIPENERYRMIFIHVPKTGESRSLRPSLGSSGSWATSRHWHINLQTRYGSQSTSSCASCETPETGSSPHLLLEQGGLDDADKRWAEEHLADYDNFPEFARALAINDSWARALAGNTFCHSRFSFMTRPAIFWSIMLPDKKDSIRNRVCSLSGGESAIRQDERTLRSGCPIKSTLMMKLATFSRMSPRKTSRDRAILSSDRLRLRLRAQRHRQPLARLALLG